jgi:hypothetical protein
LAILLLIGGVEKNLGPGAEGESFMKVMCCGCDKILKLGTQCDTCGRWFRNSCGNVKVKLVDSQKWNCEKCKRESLCMLDEKIQNALSQIEGLKLRNKKPEEQLRVARTGNEIGRPVTVQEQAKNA